jgi:hypothetical protein
MWAIPAIELRLRIVFFAPFVLFALSLAQILIQKRRKNPSPLSLSSSDLSLSCLSF